MEALPSNVYQEIRREFLAETEEMLETLEDQLRLVRSDDIHARSIALNRIYRRIHSLKGSAGMFGFPKVSALCHELEEFVERLIQRNESLAEREVGLLSKGLLLLRQTFVPVKGKHGERRDLVPGEGPEKLVAELRAFVGHDESLPSGEPAFRRPVRRVDPAPSPPSEGEAPTLARPEPSEMPREVRVSVRELERMIEIVGEIHLQSRRLLHLAQERGAERGRGKGAPSHLAPLTRLQGRRLADLRRRLQALRMVPIGRVLTPFFPLVNTLAMKSGKEIRVSVTGEETRVDRTIFEAVFEPLLHLVRNAVDHGLETPAERERAGKSRVGTLRLSARSEGHNVTIEVVDDGRGVNREAVAVRARQLGLPLSSPPRDEELWSCLFHPGFTTRDVASEISGRGVGLDVVRRMVRDLQGIVEMTSTPGKGTRLSLRMPQTLSLIRGLVACQGNLLVAFPLHLVAGVQRWNAPHHYVRSMQEKAWPGSATGDVVDLGELFQMRSTERPGHRNSVIVGIAERRLRVLVDRIIRQEELVVRPLGPLLDGHPGLAGAVELADGQLALVLDIPFLVGTASAFTDAAPQPVMSAPGETDGD